MNVTLTPKGIDVFTFNFSIKDDLLEEYHMNKEEKLLKPINSNIIEVIVSNILEHYIPSLKNYDYYFNSLSLIGNDNEIHGYIIDTVPHIYFIIELKKESK